MFFTLLFWEKNLKIIYSIIPLANGEHVFTKDWSTSLIINLNCELTVSEELNVSSKTKGIIIIYFLACFFFYSQSGSSHRLVLFYSQMSIVSAKNKNNCLLFY